MNGRDRCHIGVRLLLAAVLLPACTTEGDSGAYFAAADQPLAKQHTPSFEEFRQRTRAKGIARELYLVEGDFPIATLAELRGYYDQRVLARTPKSAVKLAPTVGPDTGQCNANPVPADCIDDRFYNGGQRGLRYCVSSTFGSNKQVVIDAMDAAGKAWQAVTNTWFQYVPDHDGVCAEGNPVPPGLNFKVSPWDGDSYACAFWPYSGRGCVPSSVVFNFNVPVPLPVMFVSTATHELGHILGLHHEDYRSDVAAMNCIIYEMRFLTDHDDQSIMGAPTVFGGCSLGGGLAISANDGVGIRKLYHLPPAWLVSTGPVLM